MSVHGIGPVKARAGAGAAADGLVILVPLVAEGQVVHRALGRRADVQRRQERIGDALGCLDVAGRHGGRIARTDERCVGQADREGLKAALVEGYVLLDQGPEHVQRRGTGDGGGRIEVARTLAGGPAEIERGASLRAIDGDAHPDRLAAVQFKRPLAVAQRGDGVADAFLGVVLDVSHVGMNDIEPEVFDHRAEFRHAAGIGRDLRLEVGHVLVRIAGGVGARGQ